MKPARVEEVKRQLQRKSIPFHNVFNSPDGMLVLEALKAEFDPSAICNPADGEFVCTMRAAQRDVIRYIENMIELRGENYDG